MKSVARSRLVLLTIGGAVILALLAVPPARSADPDLRMTTSILLPCGLFTLYLCVYGFGHVRRVARVIESLAETNNPGALGLLIRLMSIEPQSAALRSPLPSTERLAPALVRVLSRIRPEQRGLLDSEEHRLLCHLMIGPHRELAHAALDAVVRLGEPVGEAYLRLLLRDSEPGRSRITIYPGLRRRAADGLRKIEERRQRAAVGTTLLRPCGPPEPEVETLLRPALSCTTEVEKLLRPA